MKDYSIAWHNYINGYLSLKEQLEQAKWCVKALEGLIHLSNAGAIEVAGGDDWPSIIRWDVLNEDEYRRVQKEYDLPDGVVWEEEEEIEGGNDEEKH